jgi:uncharacterized protein YjbI with pentapeptide repeats
MARTKNRWQWTGFAGKTLWDVLQLLAILAIPVVVAVASIWFNGQQNQTSLQVSDRQHQTDLQIAQNQQQQASLNSYLEDIKDLLLNRGLFTSKPNNEVRIVARVETLSVLRQLDGLRKGVVIQFLSESGLITGNGKDVIIDLYGADLSNTFLNESNAHNVIYVLELHGAQLIGANLAGAVLVSSDLRKANLNGANLTKAVLYEADLSYTNLTYTTLIGAFLEQADLTGADLTDADLSGANLLNAKVTQKQLDTAISLKNTIMPDGSIHP